MQSLPAARMVIIIAIALLRRCRRDSGLILIWNAMHITSFPARIRRSLDECKAPLRS